MRTNIQMPESLIKKINSTILIDQVEKYNDDALDTYQLKLLIDSYSRIMEFGVRVYDGKFTWDEIVYMLNALNGVIIHNIGIELSVESFINTLIEYDTYDDLVGHVEVSDYTKELVEKIANTKLTNYINIYCLLHLLKATAINNRGASIGEYKVYINQYLKLKVEEQQIL